MKKVTIFWLLEFLSAILLILGAVPESFAYVSLLILLVGIWRLDNVEALQFYIFSIPIFVAMPANFLSEAMSIWRIALLVLTFKVMLQKFEIIPVLRDGGLTFGDKKNKIISDIRNFAAEIKVSNYYGIFYPALLFGTVSLLSLVFAQSFGAGIKKMIFLGSIIMLFSIVFWAVRSKDDLQKILRSTFVSGIFIMAVGYVQLISTFFINLYDFWGLWDNYAVKAFYGLKTMILLSYSNTWFSYYDSTGDVPPTLRMFSVMPDSHSFSMLMVIFIPLALFYLYLAKQSSSKRIYFSILALFFLAIFFSGSRGAWVGWAGGLAAALCFFYFKKLPSKLKLAPVKDYAENKKMYSAVLKTTLLFVVMVPIAAFVLNINQDTQLWREGRTISGERKSALLQRTWSISDMDETSNKGRWEIWQDSFASVIKYPVFGIGMGNFPLALSEKISTSKMGASAHNIYLDVAVETGIVGMIIFIWLLWKIFEKLFSFSQKFKEREFRILAFAFLISFIWICTYGMFDVVIINDKVLMFIVIILGALFKLEELEDKEISVISAYKAQ